MCKFIKCKKVKYILGIIGAIFIGAISSGIWEILLGPFILFISNYFVDTLSYLFISLEGSLFQSISKGYNEEMSFLTVMILLIIFSNLSVYVLTFFTLPTKSKIRRKMEADLENINDPELLKEMRDRLKLSIQKLERSLRKLKFVMFFMLIGLIISFFTQVIITQYKVERISEFRQRLTIVKPYITPFKYDSFYSKFCQIRTRRDYDNIMDSLSILCQQNNIEINE